MFLSGSNFSKIMVYIFINFKLKTNFKEVGIKNHFNLAFIDEFLVSFSTSITKWFVTAVNPDVNTAKMKIVWRHPHVIGDKWQETKHYIIVVWAGMEEYLFSSSFIPFSIFFVILASTDGTAFSSKDGINLQYLSAFKSSTIIRWPYLLSLLHASITAFSDFSWVHSPVLK